MNSSKAIVFTIIALLLGAGIGLAGSQGSAAWGELPLFAIAGIVIYLVHWLVFIPSWIYQTEHYFVRNTSCTTLAAASPCR